MIQIHPIATKFWNLYISLLARYSVKETVLIETSTVAFKQILLIQNALYVGKIVL